MPALQEVALDGADQAISELSPADTEMMPIQLMNFNNDSHRSAVIDLWKNVFGYEGAHNEPSMVIDKKIDAGDGLFFVAICSGAVAGTIMAGYDGHRGWLYSLAVLPEHRQQRIGSELVHHAEGVLAAKGCVKINLQIVETNSEVQAFYESAGYRKEPRISMGKRLITPTN